MAYYIGIDLGTTNSAIVTYDGENTRIWKSPEQNDVTPSAIFFDKRGNKFIGKRAYDSSASNPGRSATLFKRLMGTGTPVEFPDLGKTMTPEECSAEILNMLLSYIPEEIRKETEGTVITIPAAFNQMQRDATSQAANLAGIGKTALMQEPVAAVMSVMRKSGGKDGYFLIYDLGGGTLDIAVANATGGKVTLLSHGGIAMCGGRDFDRTLLENVVVPWLHDNFDLPNGFENQPEYQGLIRSASWATERAKINLSSSESAVITLDEREAACEDLSGEEIYIDIPINRDQYTPLINERIEESVKAAKETLEKAGIDPSKITRIVFVGGPTCYGPLREKVSSMLGIEGSTEVNPMTAVAEGAGIFAESINWAEEVGARKKSRAVTSAGGQVPVTFSYISRTSTEDAKVVPIIKNFPVNGLTIQFDSLETGWSSGRMPLMDGKGVKLPLGKFGENKFKVSVFGPQGQALACGASEICISRTAATVEGIPASHSLGVEVLEKVGGTTVLDYFVRSGEQLPKKGKMTFKAAETLKAGSSSSLNIRIWEGEIEAPITDNRAVGVLKISGTDFDYGVIPQGEDLICSYEVKDSGVILLEVSVPCIGSTFKSGKNFYSKEEDQIDFSRSAPMVKNEAEQLLKKIDDFEMKVNDPDLDKAKELAEKAKVKSSKIEALGQQKSSQQNAEVVQEAREQVLEAKKIISKVRKKNLKAIREAELEARLREMEPIIERHATDNEKNIVETLKNSAYKSIEADENEYKEIFDALTAIMYRVLVRTDEFIIDMFKMMASSPYDFNDLAKHSQLVEMGLNYLSRNQIDMLRGVVFEMGSMMIGGAGSMNMDVVNILRG